MAEFVRQNRLDFLGTVVVQQSVGQDNSPRVAESGESRICLLALF